MYPGGPVKRDQDLALAIQHHEAGRLDHAEQLYQGISAADRRDTEVIYLLGVLCCDLGLFDAACKFLDEALAITPEFPEARRQLAVALNGLADLKSSAGLLKEAKALLQRANELVPHDPQTLQGLGRVALMGEDAAGGESLLEASLVRRSDDPDPLNWLGLARLQLAKYAAAEASLCNALALRPELNQ